MLNATGAARKERLVGDRERESERGEREKLGRGQVLEVGHDKGPKRRGKVTSTRSN